MQDTSPASRPPVIGLNCSLRARAPRRQLRLELLVEYTRSVELAGGLPVALPVTEDRTTVERQLDLVDGLVLIGGPDYSPALYGAEPHPKFDPVHPVREFYDLELARAAVRRGIPILGICGGCQLLNLVCGGTLVQHIPDSGAPVRHFGGSRLRHEVVVEPGSALEWILGRDRLLVNTAHHQAVERVGSGLRVAARSADGVIEAVESTGDAFLLGIQWHPERLAHQSAEHLAIFKALVAASNGRPGAA